MPHGRNHTGQKAIRLIEPMREWEHETPVTHPAPAENEAGNGVT